jgi:hypothetical protein
MDNDDGEEGDDDNDDHRQCSSPLFISRQQLSHSTTDNPLDALFDTVQPVANDNRSSWRVPS